ncbi:hypothetical protein [Bifidobacterium myosotis]|uniref:Type II toxin-antitoxin system PemK/MazF family toxin n=1 Tax=Bifidobacterium myosotis TaxID=1630166 RepID=A0A5M9ZH62_9BIFI|nr:hypothetical protein [Bifidobacterium myosotis]KAA8826934.1 hypothetical protein EMO91_10410 [Bifidobacterium myosotis]
MTTNDENPSHPGRRPRVNDIWYARYPFWDKPGSRSRPVVIVAITDEGFDFAAAKLTSHSARATDPGDVPLRDWRQAGLSRPTTARMAQIRSLPFSALDTTHEHSDNGFVGRLTFHDATELTSRALALDEGHRNYWFPDTETMMSAVAVLDRRFRFEGDVHPGAFCTAGYGRTAKGTPMVCAPGADGRNRWRQA